MLTNKTKIPTKTLEKLIKFVTPKNLNLSNFDIIVKNCAGPYSCDFHWGDGKPYIILRYGHFSNYPIKFSYRSDKVKRTGYSGNYFFPNKTSAMIFTAAHEIQHYIQYLDDKMKFWLYHDITKAEANADQYGFFCLEKFYKLKEKGKNPLK